MYTGGRRFEKLVQEMKNISCNFQHMTILLCLFLVLALSERLEWNEELYKEKWWKAAWLDPD